MDIVTVYYFTRYDITSDELVLSKGPATLEAIARFLGVPKEGSALRIHKSRLDGEGRLLPSRASRMPTPEKRAVIAEIELTEKCSQDIDAFERALAKGPNLYCPWCWPDPQPLASLDGGRRLGCPRCQRLVAPIQFD